MNAIPTSRRDFLGMPSPKLYAIYRAARTAVCARDGITAERFDDDASASAAQLIAIGWDRASAFASVALGDYLAGFTTNHNQTSAETIEWGGFLGGPTFSTTERHAAAYRALLAAA